jgi:predicted HAD superfamily Cof-like phosphohydrolase
MVAPFKSIAEALLSMDLRTMLEFNKKFGFVVHQEPTHLSMDKAEERFECMNEELQEFKDAFQEQDMAKMLDALVDLDYFLKGTIVMMGLQHAYAAAWVAVHGANMEKVPGIGPRGFTVDLIKPAGWVPPNMDAILSLHGYRRSNFVDPTTGKVDETKCCDELKVQLALPTEAGQ